MEKKVEIDAVELEIERTGSQSSWCNLNILEHF